MIKDFTVEYSNAPIGLDTIPRFSWKLESEKSNVRQVCYQLMVITDGRMIWDSSRVESDASQLVRYQGSPLEPMTEYHVQVQVWDNYGEMSQAVTSFETGLLQEEHFQADWITWNRPENNSGCPVFTKDFTAQKAVRKARLYASACGVYEAALNGDKIGDDYMAPGWTSYHHRMEYQTYDMTEQIHRGANQIEITVGNGWYCGYLGFDERPNHYGTEVSVIAMIALEYEDGTCEVVGTDDSWEVTSSPIVSSEIYYGEVQNLIKQKEHFGNAILLEDTGTIGTLISQESEPVRITKRLTPIKKIITPKGELVFDFGQNLAGIVEVTLPKLLDEKLVIRHAETLDKDGNFYTENLRTAKSEDHYWYTNAQSGRKAAPHFTFHGFRYICVEGTDADISADHFCACAFHTDMKQTGSFHTDNALVNQLQSNIEWGQRGNFIDIPTDCPQRNERLGWTGDAQVFCGTASYQFQTARFFRKWIRDMAAESTMTWGVPHVVPNILGDQAGAAAWSDAATIIPWTTYRIYGDKETLREQFPLMKLWVDYIRSKVGANGLWQDGFQYGDWLALDIESGSTDRTGGTDQYLVANAYYALSTRIVRDAAEELGLADEAAEYGTLYEQIRDAINEEFITKTGRLVCETQTACVLMIYFDIAKPTYRDRILKTLENNVNAHHGHLTTGFVGTPYLCHCLSENGLHEMADEIFMKEDFPSWFYAVKKGATTIWERWNSILPNGDFDQSGMNSLNHYAYGCIGSWLYEKVAGITAAAPGYRKIRIQPYLTKGITSVNASYESIYGTIRSAWTCRDGRITVDVTIPANTTAVIVLPETDREISVGSGSYHYEYETTTRLEPEPFSMESTLGEIVREDLGKQMLESAIPGILDNPMIKFAMDMTLSELLVQGPEAKPLYEAIVQSLNAKAQQELRDQ